MQITTEVFSAFEKNDGGVYGADEKYEHDDEAGCQPGLLQCPRNCQKGSPHHHVPRRKSVYLKLYMSKI